MVQAGFETVPYGSTPSGNLRAYMSQPVLLGPLLLELLERGGGSAEAQAHPSDSGTR